jgi:hypothetical protein
MKKWEYAHLFYNNGETYTFNKEDHEYQPGESFLDVMNSLGEEGWELVTRDDDQGYYFKRSLRKTEKPPELPR